MKIRLVSAVPANAFNNPQPVRKDPDNRQSIAMAVHDLVSAWNQHDAEAIAGLFPSRCGFGHADWQRPSQ
jgi:hypothetical protein